jgi:ABC-2 type transport system ATP-binding protein
MEPILRVQNLQKTYANGFQALKNINLDIERGEIFALLGPNGAGKTTLISIICGIVTASQGHVSVEQFDTIRNYRETRSLIGLVPQELTTDAFITPEEAISFSRGLFNKPPNQTYIDQLLRDLSLWDKRDQRIYALSGGMKRRLLMGKALAHEPKILFLDEPSSGVDVELRKGMWQLVRKLRRAGVTIVLTTHYIEEAEALADRVGIINNGEIILVRNKEELMNQMSHKQMTVELERPLDSLPKDLESLTVKAEGKYLTLHYDPKNKAARESERFLHILGQANISIVDITTRSSSLEEIFLDLVKEKQPV